MSSPGSTAPSATTPAVHDVSANTSPDNDGQHFLDVERKENEDKEESKDDKNTTKRTDSPATRPGISADEDQLLQESIRSSAAASGSEDETRPQQTPGANTLPTPTSNGRKGSADEAAESIEVADSQDDTGDRMDIDSTPKPAATTSQPEQAKQDHSAQSSRDSTGIPERAVTRVSSGAMRLKSVNEIVGAGPRSTSTSDRGTGVKGIEDQLTPSASAPQSPSSKSRSGQSRTDKLRNQVSTVLFGKQPKRVDDRAVMQGQKDAFHPFDDYYTPLFIQNFTGATNWMQPMEKVLFHANKTVGTDDANLAIQDHQACKVLRRVYHLQQHDKWSLRQPKRCPEPTRPTSHWDVLLQEMKWMRTDFKEERKWKTTLARNMAYACAQWFEASPEERKLLQVPAIIPPKDSAAEEDVKMDDIEEVADSQQTPELVPSGDGESLHNEDELVEPVVETVAPSAIFSLQEYDIVFGLRQTPASDELLDQLPLYGAPLKVPRPDLANPDFDPDAHWKRPALPLSKYVEGEMKIATPKPPKRRGRYEYENEESDDDGDATFVTDEVVAHAQLPPNEDAVALFNPENKAMRDRLHAGHQFRPPSEHQMPMQSFYECRSSSQWTPAEDSELKKLVRECSYNWSLISNMLSTKSSFQSGAERRTPWECFERWISLEGLPADMQRTAYFKAYNGRIEGAQRVIAQQNQRAVEQAQQASAAGNTVTPIRRRPSVPVSVERRRAQKHLTMLDAMRKLAKKRETTIQKQQHNAAQNAMKKTNEAVAQRPTKTPRDYSLLRWERDQALAEKMAQYAQRQEAQRRAALQARVAQQGGQAGSVPAGVNGQAAPNVAHPGANVTAANGAARPGIPNQLAAAAAAGRRLPMQGAAGVPGQANGGMVPPAQMKGIPQAQIQAALASQQRLAMAGNQQPDANLMLRAQRMAEQQRAAVQMQQAQQHPQHIQNQAQQGGAGSPGQQGQAGSPPLRNGVNGINQQNFMNSAQAMLAAYNNGNGAQGSPQANGVNMANGTPNAAAGPRMPAQLPASIAAQLNQLETQLRAKHPNMTPEQARTVATEQLTRAMLAQRQSAMNAAAGAGAGQSGLANGIAATTSPHQYAALLRQQQQAQAAAQRQAAQQKGGQQSPQPQQQQGQAGQQQLTAQQRQQQQQAAAQQAAAQQQQQQKQSTPAASSASPVPQQVQQQHQRQASGSATPSSEK